MSVQPPIHAYESHPPHLARLSAKKKRIVIRAGKESMYYVKLLLIPRPVVSLSSSLRHQGWTADDYEVGCKGKAAELNGNVQLVQKHRDLKREGEEQERDSRPSLPPVQTASKQLRPTPLEQQQHMRREMQKQVTSRITMPRSLSSNY